MYGFLGNLYFSFKEFYFLAYWKPYTRQFPFISEAYQDNQEHHLIKSVTTFFKVAAKLIALKGKNEHCFEKIIIMEVQSRLEKLNVNESSRVGSSASLGSHGAWPNLPDIY